MIMFRRELKNNIKDEIMRDERDYESLAELVEIVIDFDDKLYERVMKKRYDQFRNRAELIYESAAEYAKSKQQLYIKNSEYTEFALMKLKMTHRHKKKNSKNKKKDKEKKLCYKCEKTDHFVRNCRNESVMCQRQLNVTLKKISKTDDMKKAVNGTIIQEINSNDEYCIVSSKTKLQKIIDAASNKTKQINFRIEKFRRSSTSHSNCTEIMFKSDLEYDWDDQIEQVLNETFKKLEALINLSSSQKKKEQCINDIVDIFEKTLNSDASIKSQRESFEKLSKTSKGTWIM